ncbi:MAG: hypothetical protein LBG74_06910 [Spirochaetaceae bacterium]|jgi:hypothetical protein|nr:hypothetical protein [Spirochaetaceae bacterium]
MATGVLIAGTENLLLSALVRRMAKDDVPNTLALIGHAEKPGLSAADKSEGKSAFLEWGAGPLAARALVLAAENRLNAALPAAGGNALGTAILVCAPPARFLSANPDVSEINSVIDRYVKSYMFLVRELRRAFTKRGGILAFVSAGGGAFGGALCGVITAAFSAFAEELFVAAAGEKLIGFSSAQALSGAEAADENAGVILKTLSNCRKNDFCKWHKTGASKTFLDIIKR